MRWVRASLDFLRRLLAAAHQDQMLFLASALAFDALLAAIPFAVLILAVLGYAVAATGASGADVHSLLGRLFPAHGAAGEDPFARVERFVVQVAANRGDLSLYAAPFFLGFATRFYGSVRKALNTLFETEEARSLLRRLLVDFALVVVTTVLFVGNAVLTAQTIFSGFPARFLAVFSSFSYGVALFFAVYLMAPSRRVPWQTALIAALVASMCFEIAKKLFGLYLAEFATLDQLLSNTNAVAVLLFVFWIYYTMCVFLVGGEVAGVIDQTVRGEKSEK